MNFLGSGFAESRCQNKPQLSAKYRNSASSRPCTWGINQIYLKPENAKLEEEAREQILENKLSFVTSRDPLLF